MNKFLENISYGRIILSVIVIVAFAVCFVLLGRARKKIIGKAKNSKDTKNVLVRRMVSLARALLVVFAFLTVSQINGINLGSIIAGLGILSAVIGLALQDLLKDVIMGVHIVTDKFFAIGDVVEYNGKEGVVVGFSLTATKLKLTDDDSELTVSNRNISEIAKKSGMFMLDVPLSYDEDARKVHEILTETASKIKEIKGIKNCVFAGTQGFENSSVLYRFIIYCDPKDIYVLRRKALFAIQNQLDSENIKIPYNKIDINIKERNNNGN